MIILDTNVISEPLRQAPNAGVITWLDSQAADTLFLTTVTVAEVRYGIAALPAGRRRDHLHTRFEQDVFPLFARRVLAFDEAATVAYAALRSEARRQGRALGDFDALIGAIARAQGFTVATRDTAPFEAAGVPVINPFEVGTRG